jgi:hypothetical protein
VTSEFERNYQKYGYDFPDPVNKPWYWTKTDGTDVTNYDEAKKLAEKWEDVLRKVVRKRKWLFKHTSFGHGDYTYEHIKSLDWDEYKKIPRVPGNMLLVKEQVMRDYFNPLMKLLREKKDALAR